MQEENIKALPSRLEYFPVTMFAVVMGMSGLAISFKKAHEILNFSSIFSNITSTLAILVFILVALTYIAKIVKYPLLFKAELIHPVRINFFAAISISFVLVSILFQDINKNTALVLLYFGAVLHLFLTFYTLKFWITKPVEIAHSNPAWFIPIVGNLIIPIGGGGILDNDILMYYFSIGIFFWIIMLAIILNRIIFHHQFIQKFMPTLFILIAPPSVGLLSYFELTQSLDMFAYILFNLGLFFTLLLIFMYKSFINIEFFISWWAFTFPLAAITLATMLMYAQTQKVFYMYGSYFFLLFLSIVVTIVAYNTVKSMIKKEICVME